MIFIFPIGFLVVIFLMLLGTGTKLAYDFLEWFVKYWWVFGILSAIKCFVVNFFDTAEHSIGFLIADIIKTSLAYFVLVSWANACLDYFHESGAGSVFMFILEVVSGAIVLGGILGYGYGVCLEARYEEEIGNYVFGCIVVLIAAMICVVTY